MKSQTPAVGRAGADTRLRAFDCGLSLDNLDEYVGFVRDLADEDLCHPALTGWNRVHGVDDAPLEIDVRCEHQVYEGSQRATVAVCFNRKYSHMKRPLLTVDDEGDGLQIAPPCGRFAEGAVQIRAVPLVQPVSQACRVFGLRV